MRRITFISLLLTMAVGMQAQTVKALIEKYKEFPEAQYITKSGEEYRMMLANDPKWNDKLESLMNIKSVEAIMLPLNESQRTELANDMKALKGFEEIVNMLQNCFPDDDYTNKYIIDDDKDELKHDVIVKVYGKTNKKDVTELVAVMDLFGLSSILHFKGRIAIDAMQNLVDVKITNESHYTVDDDDDDDEFSKIVKQSNDSCVVAFDNVIQPDIKNAGQGIVYINNNGMAYDGVDYLIGKDKVKERWPQVDADFVLIFQNVRNVENKSDDK